MNVATIKTQPMKIPGRWRDGYALDYHTISSTYLGEDEYGHAQFDTKRSEAGELLYQLKYRSDASLVDPLAEACAAFLAGWKPTVNVLLPVPSSKTRTVQPVILVATALATLTGLTLQPTAVKRTKDLPELKNVYEYHERIQLLADAHSVEETVINGRGVLLFDDLYRSGATMNAITAALYDHGAADVFALTITRTRSNQ
jgi:competence protein ComFC